MEKKEVCMVKYKKKRRREVVVVGCRIQSSEYSIGDV